MLKKKIINSPQNTTHKTKIWTTLFPPQKGMTSGSS